MKSMEIKVEHMKSLLANKDEELLIMEHRLQKKVCWGGCVIIPHIVKIENTIVVICCMYIFTCYNYVHWC